MMRNLTDCSFAQERGLFEVLHDLVPNAGAATALRCAARLSDIFAEIRDTARQNVADMKNGGLSRDQYDLLERTQKKRLEDEDKAREQAEYMSLQNKLLAGIQTWFQQQILIAAGIPRAILPLPLPEETSGIQVSQDAAENAARLVDELIRHLEANVYEPLALDAFCLEVCEKRLV